LGGLTPAAAVVLVAPGAVLRARASERDRIERSIEQPYNSALWQAIYDNLDVTSCYRRFLDALDRWDIPFVLVDSTTPAYEPIRSWAAAERRLVGEAPTRAPLDGLDAGQGAYQAGSTGDVDMAGTYDRSTSFPIVFDQPLIGSSILDIGCAEGLFCFEAEARGASRVVGIDVKGERLARARTAAEQIGSAVRFFERDLSGLSDDETYERVLLLNVLHYLPDPVAALEAVSRLVERDLVLEFPTLDDPRFRTTIADADLSDSMELPLIGVSTAAVDQTYVFTEAAIDRMLRGHLSAPFADVAFLPSPNPSRRIAIARRA
jgi:2-polyprenyl-3-methyl-5-hydroxy-6-metoxy-1,4-benzoquinol methylase